MTTSGKYKLLYCWLQIEYFICITNLYKENYSRLIWKIQHAKMPTILQKLLYSSKKAIAPKLPVQ